MLVVKYLTIVCATLIKKCIDLDACSEVFNYSVCYITQEMY